MQEPYNYLSSLPGKEIRTKLIEAFNVWLDVPEADLGIIKNVVRMLHTASLLYVSLSISREAPQAKIFYANWYLTEWTMLRMTVNCVAAYLVSGISFVTYLVKISDSSIVNSHAQGLWGPTDYQHSKLRLLSGLSRALQVPQQEWLRLNETGAGRTEGKKTESSGSVSR